MSLKNKLHSRLKKWGGDWLVLIISLLLALVLGGLFKLSDTYTTFFHYKISIHTALPNRVYSAVSENAAVVRGTASGFYIFKHQYFTKRNKNTINIAVEPGLMMHVSGVKGKEDEFYVLAEDISDQIRGAVKNEIDFQGVVADTLFFTFPHTSTKKVPVSATTLISYKEQYMPFGKIQLKPDSVTLYGEEKVLATIDSVETKEIKGRNLKEPLQGVIDLKKIKGVVFSSEEVYYYQDAGRYFENTITVPIYSENVPADMQLILSPNIATVIYREDYNKKVQYDAADFILTADYNQIVGSLSGRAKVLLNKVPDGVYSVRIVPGFVAAILGNAPQQTSKK
ncbi:MAG: hypothetical protein LKM37_00085 [Bacteroidales bacterium]|jgi:hypothetical protein|nr:hypothetical protein [Bacteroidales bacterium]MCI1733373.1 hypothetical protein [Bacteroidales bacterium]